jgi:tetratricopeptide (TPR) repeat protein
MRSDDLQEPRALMARRLGELLQAAGAPTLDAVARAAHGNRSQTASRLAKRISAWKTGADVPRTFAELESVVRVLIPLSRRQGATDASMELLDVKQWRKWWTAAREASPPITADQPAMPGQLINADLDPFGLEVHHAISDKNSMSTLTLPAYIEREHDRNLRRIVESARTQSRLAVLVGGSSTGKTRSCWEAVQPLAGWRLWHPISPSGPKALLDALANNVIAPNTVLWLNEMQHYLLDPGSELGEKVAAGLRELIRNRSRGPVLVLGTLWPEKWDTLTRQPGPFEPDRYPQCRALLAGQKIKVPDTFEEVDITALPEQTLVDERITQALKRPDKRVTQFLAGGFELLSRYESAPASARALIDAAIDASRFGAGSDLPIGLLTDAAPGYLTDYEWNELDDTWSTSALEYAGRPCLGVGGPLTRIRPRSSNPPPAEAVYRVADYLEDRGHESRRYTMPPETFWEAIAKRASSPEDLLDVAYELSHRGRYRNAARIYLMAADSGEANGLLFLADNRRRAGDRANAEELFKVAAGQGSLVAHANLAELRHEAGDTESAKQILKSVLIDHPIESDDRSFAWGRLVDICEDAGDIRTPRRWLKHAASEGDESAGDELARLDHKHDKSETTRRLMIASAGFMRSHRELGHMYKRMIRLSRANSEGFSWMLQYLEEKMAEATSAPVIVDNLVILGRVHGVGGNQIAAEAIFLKALNAMADEYVKGANPALVELVKVLKKKGDIDTANRLWKYGLELDGSIARPWKALDQRPRAAR